MKSVKQKIINILEEKSSASLLNKLREAFASEFAFYLKAHFFHWNVESTDFSEYHELFGKIYEEVYGSIDDFAENIRKSNGYAPGSFGLLSSLSVIKGNDVIPEVKDMISELLEDSDKMANLLSEVYKIAEASNEFGLANFLADRQDAHKKHSWMLRASLK